MKDLEEALHNVQRRNFITSTKNSTEPIKIAVVGMGKSDTLKHLVGHLISNSSIPIVVETMTVGESDKLRREEFNLTCLDEISDFDYAEAERIVVLDSCRSATEIAEELAEVAEMEELPDDTPVKKKKKRMSRMEKMYRYGGG